jgi:Cu2+-exporting ATPase
MEHQKHNHQSGKIDKDRNSHKHKGGHDHHDHSKMITEYKKRFWLSLALTIPILLLSPMIQKFVGLQDTLSFNGSIYILFILSSIVFFYGGYPFLSGMVGELKKANPGMMTLIGLAISVAYFYSSAVVFGLSGKIFFWELVTLVDIMLLGHWIEMKSVMGASKALEELAKLMPSDAHKILDDGNIVDIPLEELKTDDRILIKPGEKVPADGVVVNGHSSLNEAMLTGESKPVNKKAEDKVIGGAVNGEGSLEVVVEKTGRDSFLSQVIVLVKEAQESKSKTQDLANRAAFWLTIIALTGGTITLAYWLAIGEQDFVFVLLPTDY